MYNEFVYEYIYKHIPKMLYILHIPEFVLIVLDWLYMEWKEWRLRIKQKIK